MVIGTRALPGSLIEAAQRIEQLLEMEERRRQGQKSFGPRTTSAQPRADALAGQKFPLPSSAYSPGGLLGFVGRGDNPPSSRQIAQASAVVPFSEPQIRDGGVGQSHPFDAEAAEAAAARLLAEGLPQETESGEEVDPEEVEPAQVEPVEVAPEIIIVDGHIPWNKTAGRVATYDDLPPLLRPFAYFLDNRNPHTGEVPVTASDRAAAVGAFLMDGVAGGALPKALSGARAGAVRGRAAPGASAAAAAQGVLELSEAMSEAAQFARAAASARIAEASAAQLARAAKLGLGARALRRPPTNLQKLEAHLAKKLKHMRQFVYDDRAWSTVRKARVKAGNYPKGRSAHHWFFAQRHKGIPRGIVNARWNTIVLPKFLDKFVKNNPWGDFNRWMGMEYKRNPWARASEWAIRLGIPTIVGGGSYGVYRGGEEGYRALFDHTTPMRQPDVDPPAAADDRGRKQGAR